LGSEAFTEHAPFASPLTTKGDVYTYDSADQRLPVGTDGQVLSSNSAQATGLKWIDAVTWAIKTGDQTFTNNTLANVTDMSFSVAASTSYFVEAFLLLSSDNTNADFKFGWTAPASATMFWGDVGTAGSTSSGWFPSNTGSTPDAMLTVSDTFSCGGGSLTNGVVFWAIVRNSTNAGTLQFQAAQNTTQAGTSTKVLKDSFLRYRKLQ
jgi:hypothetical protein